MDILIQKNDTEANREKLYALIRLHQCLKSYQQSFKIYEILSSIDKIIDPINFEKYQNSEIFITNTQKLVYFYNLLVAELKKQFKLQEISLSIYDTMFEFDVSSTTRAFEANSKILEQELKKWNFEDVKPEINSKIAALILDSYDYLHKISTKFNSLKIRLPSRGVSHVYIKDAYDIRLNKMEEEHTQDHDVVDKVSIEDQSREILLSVTDFIQDFFEDSELMEILQNDIGEVLITFNNQAYKASCIMVVSIIESLLREALSIACKNSSETFDLIQDLTFFKLCSKAREEKIIKRTTDSLVEAARYYRNSIHTSTSKKNVGSFDMIIATVVIFTLDIVCRDLSEWKKQRVTKI